MATQDLPQPEAGITLFSFPEQLGAMVLASDACARAFGFARPRLFANWVRRHMDRFGPAYARDLVEAGAGDAKIVRLTFETVELCIIYVALEFGDGRPPVAVIAAVLPSEQEAGERSAGELRRHLKKLAAAGAFLPQ